MREASSRTVVRFGPSVCPSSGLSLVARPENFFKHADRDPDGVIEFRPSLTKFFLFDAVEMYRQLTVECSSKGSSSGTGSRWSIPIS